jgi:hypothetical protein
MADLNSPGAQAFRVPALSSENVILLLGDAMSRAIIRSGFASATETAEVLGVSRAKTEKLIRMAERALSSTRGRSKAKNGPRTIARKARKR